MSDPQIDLTPTVERTDYTPLLDAVVPAIILISSAAYAWSVRDMPNADLNLLFLRPLFVVIWAILLIVIVKEVVPSLARYGEWRRASAAGVPSWREWLVSDTEGRAALVVAATFLFSLHGPGDGPIPFMLSAFVYLAVVGFLIGDRHPLRLFAQAALLSVGLYLIMGVLLGVRL